MQTREQLPMRRQNETIELDHKGRRFTVTAGYDGDGSVREVFCSGHKESDLEHLVSDACVVISMALQSGYRPADISRSLGRIPTFTGAGVGEGPASPIGMILQSLRDRPELDALSRVE